MARRRSHFLAMEPEAFAGLVRQAIDGLPSEYRRLLKNVAIVVEETPSRDILNDLGLESDDDLLGLYSGTPLEDESFFNTGGELPARISIYRRPILRVCRSAEEVVHEVRDTVIHEIGHHFGLDDDEMPY
jgi:predicted Zn-dependent protease with MMP-like domain